MCVRVFNQIVKCAEDNTVLSSREGKYICVKYCSQMYNNVVHHFTIRLTLKTKLDKKVGLNKDDTKLARVFKTVGWFCLDLLEIDNVPLFQKY